MSISAPSYSDPDRLVPFLSSERADTAAEAREAAKGNAKKPLTAFAEGDDNPSFWDVLDVINPLQHIPVVNNIYREMTGDQIGVAARVVGGTLFGGPVGLVASAVDCMVEAETGENMGGHALAMIRGPSSANDTATATAIASAEQKPSKGSDTTSTGTLAAVTLPDAAPVPLKPVELASAKAADPLLTKAVAPQAMTVSLPDMVSSSQDLSRANMAFGLDGSVQSQTASAPVSVAAVSATHPAVTAALAVPPSAPVQVARPSVDAVSGSAAMTQQVMLHPAKNLTMPERKNFQNGNGPAPISVPVSGGASRSNVPVTGRDPVSSRTSAATNLQVQRAMAQQGLANAQHPMLPSADGSTKVNTGGSDWFTSAFTQAMDKYQKNSTITQQQAATQSAPAGNLY